MSTRGSITLGELRGKLDLLDVACHRCERRGRVNVERLIEEHGADTGLPDLWERLAGDCQHARSTALNNRCAIYFRNCRRCFCRARKRNSDGRGCCAVPNAGSGMPISWLVELPG